MSSSTSSGNSSVSKEQSSSPNGKHEKLPVVEDVDMDLSDYDEDVASYNEDEDESLGSLKDFIVDSEEEGSASEEEEDTTDDVKTPESADTISVGENKIMTGKRVRKPVQHYIPENVEQLMLTKGGKVDLEDLFDTTDEEDENCEDCSDEEDDDYVTEDDDDDDDDDFE